MSSVERSTPSVLDIASGEVVVVKAGQRRAAVQAKREIERGAGVSGPQRVVSAAERPSISLDLSTGMHRKRSSASKPELVAGSSKQLQKRETVAGCAVAEVRALRERARAPGELAAGQQQALVFVVAWCDLRKRSDHPRCAVAPLHADVLLACDEIRAGEPGPVCKPVLLDREASEGVACATVQLLTRLVRKRKDTARKPVHRPQVLLLSSVEVLCPEARVLPSLEKVVGALAPIKERAEKMLADEAELDRLLALGAARAREVASRTIAQVRDRVGFLAAR